MQDSFGRKIEYLRISLTDRCNLRCRYCTPEGGIQSSGNEEKLTTEEILRISELLASLGIRRIRLTGGEPLIRKDTEEIVGRLKSIPGLSAVSMTTNGSLLSGRVEALKKAGLDSINISLDTLNPLTFRQMTGSDRLFDVLEGIREVKDAGVPFKINCVPVLGMNEKEIEEIALIAGKEPVDVRFIELMPLGCGVDFTGLSSGEILDRLEAAFGAAEADDQRSSTEGPAGYYRFEGFAGRIGLISPVSGSFCAQCNRVRLTSDGFLKLCLRHSSGVDLRTPLRDGAAEEDLKRILEEAVMQKPASHDFWKDVKDPEEKRMVQIGG